MSKPTAPSALISLVIATLALGASSAFAQDQPPTAQNAPAAAQDEQPSPPPTAQNAPQNPPPAPATTQSQAQAQTQAANPPATGTGLEEVVVTARYRQENLQQTPIAITAITSQDIEQRGFTTSSEIAYTVPNASFRQAQQAFGNTQTAYIRGIGQFDFNFAFEPGVGIYVDDVYYPTVMSSEFDLLDLERVEVLRGPQGTLFGRGSIGGAVRYVSKKPTGEGTGFIEATAGDFHRLDLRAGYDFAIVPDKFFARITGVAKKQDGYQKVYDFACLNPTLAGNLRPTTMNRLGNCQTGTLGGTDVQGARGLFRFVASDSLEFLVSADFQRDDSEARADTLMGIGPLIPTTFGAWSQFMQTGQITFTPPVPGAGPVTTTPNPNFQGFGVPYDSRFLTGDPFKTYDTFSDPYSGLFFPPRTSLTQKGASGTMDWKLGESVNFKFIAAWRNWNGSFSTDQDGSPLGLSVVDGLQEFTYRTFEAQLTGRAFTRLDWTLGAFYYDGNSASAQQVQLPGVLPAFVQAVTYAADPKANALLVNGLDHGHFENASAFAHGIINLTDRWHATLGIRYSKDKKSDLNDNTIVVQQVSSDSSRVDWLAGTDFQFTPSVMAYFSAATGYRPPAFNPRPFQASQFRPVDGEELTSFEVGTKMDLFDRKARFNFDVFYGDYKKRIIPAGGVECVKNPDGTVVGPPPGSPGFPNPQGGPPCATPAGTPLTAYVNAPAKMYGAELEFFARPVEGLLFNASAGYTHFDADTITFEGAPFNGITPSGMPVYVPEWTASASLQYGFNLPNGNVITPRYDAYMTTQICAGAPTATYTALTSCAGGYTLQNIRLEYAGKDRSWTAAVGLTNVTDKTYFLNIFDLTGFGEPTIEGQPGQPRAWFLTFTRNFQ
jgi:iron complex outermembrane receptor protein